MGIEKNLRIIFMDGLKLTTNYLSQEGVAYLVGGGGQTSGDCGTG